MHLVTRAKHAVIPLALGLLLPSRSVWAGPGAVDLGPNPLPFNQGVLTTEINPSGLQFTPGIYRATTGRVLGGVVIETGNIRNLCFVTDAPSMGTLAAGILNEQPITGTTLYCAGADVKCGGWYYECAQTIATCFALTDAVIAVQDQAYGEYPLPAPPLWAGAVGSCELNPDPDLYHCLLSLNVVTQDNSFVSVMGGVQFNYAIPAPLVVPPQTYTDGPIAGVLLMTATQAISIYAGVVDVTNLPGAYVGHVAFNDGVDITTTAGVVHKSLIFYPPFSLMDFGMCTAGNISFNNNWCWDIAGVAMGWPVPGLQCPGAQVIPGGAIDAGRRPVIIPPKLQSAKAPKLGAGADSLLVYGGPGSLLGKFEDVNHVFPQQQGWTHVDWTDGSGKPYTGDFAKLFTQFSELDPCHEDNRRSLASSMTAQSRAILPMAARAPAAALPTSGTTASMAAGPSMPPAASVGARRICTTPFSRPRSLGISLAHRTMVRIGSAPGSTSMSGLICRRRMGSISIGRCDRTPPRAGKAGEIGAFPITTPCRTS